MSEIMNKKMNQEENHEMNQGMNKEKKEPVLVVLAAGKTAGTDMMQPVALVCIGGLIYATLLTLLVVPVIYDIFNGEKFKFVKASEIDVSDIIVQ